MPPHKLPHTETHPDLALQELASYPGPKGDTFSWHLTSGLAIWKALIKKSLKPSKSCVSFLYCLCTSVVCSRRSMTSVTSYPRAGDDCCSPGKQRSFQRDRCEQSLKATFLRARLITGIWQAPHTANQSEVPACHDGSFHQTPQGASAMPSNGRWWKDPSA